MNQKFVSCLPCYHLQQVWGNRLFWDYWQYLIEILATFQNHLLQCGQDAQRCMWVWSSSLIREPFLLFFEKQLLQSSSHLRWSGLFLKYGIIQSHQRPSHTISNIYYYKKISRNLANQEELFYTLIFEYPQQLHPTRQNHCSFHEEKLK